MRHLEVFVIRRWSDKNQSTGFLEVRNVNGQPVFGSLCIERGDRQNKKNVSRVPAGRYLMELEWSPKFKRKLWELKEVPNRSECKIHPSNYWGQLNGCIAPGINLTDLDRDGYYDVTSSVKTTNDFHRAMGSATLAYITIVDEI